MLDDELDLQKFDPETAQYSRQTIDPSNLLVGHPVSFRQELAHPAAASGHKRLIKSRLMLDSSDPSTV